MIQPGLKKCPCCGSQDVDHEFCLGWYKDGGKLTGPGCMDCGLMAVSVKEWNNRPQTINETLDHFKKTVKQELFKIKFFTKTLFRAIKTVDEFENNLKKFRSIDIWKSSSTPLEDMNRTFESVKKGKKSGVITNEYGTFIIQELKQPTKRGKNGSKF